MPLKQLGTSGFTFAEEEVNLEFKFKVLNSIMLVTVVFAFLFGAFTDLGINDIGPIQSKVDYLYSAITLILLVTLRRSKSYFPIIAAVFLVLSFLTFVSALLFVVHDEFRIIWFYFVIYATYILLGSLAGAIMTIASLVAVFACELLADLHLSDTAIFSAVVGLFVGGLLSNAYSSQISRYERQLEKKTQDLERSVDDLNEALGQATEAGRAKNMFLASASHDLRQPVHALNLFVESLRNEVTTESQRILLQHIDNSTATLSGLLSSLLDISKLDAGVVVPAYARTSMADVLDTIIEEFEPQARRKGLELRLYRRDHELITDPVLMANILRNLVSNALRYTESGGVLISCRPRRGALLLQVWDTGIGIPVQERERIFTEFHQLHNPERDRNKGLGLGLAICRRTCELLGYKLSLVSHPGRGSTFSILMPMDRAEGLLPVAKDEAQRVRLPTQGLKGRRVLVIDDEADVRQAMSILLERWGCRVMLADDIGSALATAAQVDYQIDGIIADYRLRNNTTGINAINAITDASGRAIPAMLVTGDTDPQRISEVKRSGHILLHKPVKAAHLRNALTRLLLSA